MYTVYAALLQASQPNNPCGRTLIYDLDIQKILLLILN